MTELVLMRHAKAGPADDDLHRSLTAEGHRQADRAAEALVQAGFHVGRVLCSPALRTRETLTPIRSALHVPEADIVLDQAIYNASAGRLRDLIGEHLPASPLLLVGHNPGLEQLAAWLTGDIVPLGTGDWVLLDVGGKLANNGARLVESYIHEQSGPNG